METAQTAQLTTDEAYNHAAELFTYQDKNNLEIVAILTEKGIDRQTAIEITDYVENELRSAKKKAAQKDILYGALWCLGGLGLTLADVGFIFWGAILFGGIQLVKGVIAYNK